jgi:hypothetical protein
LHPGKKTRQRREEEKNERGKKKKQRDRRTLGRENRGRKSIRN